MNPRIYLSSPHMGGSERDYVTEAFNTNWIAPLGPNVIAFEESLEKYLGQDCNVTALSSGTAALHLALILLDVGRGDEVICQSLTFSASANPIVYQGASPVFVDSEPDTWNICPDRLEDAIKDRIANGKKPKAIIAVHLYGMPFKVDEVLAISRKYEIPLVEDAAESLGSTYNDRPCGTFGDISILSFNGNKIITTSGGGALVSKNRTLTTKALFLATQAKEDAPHYEHKEIGYNYRMSNICAGIGRGQMEVLDEHVKLRRSNHEMYSILFAGVPGVTVFTEPSEAFNSNHWLSCIVVDESAEFTTEDLSVALAGDTIESRPLWKPMHLQPVFSKALMFGGSVSEKLFSNGLCLPSGSNLTKGEKERIQKVIRQFT